MLSTCIAKQHGATVGWQILSVCWVHDMTVTRVRCMTFFVSSWIFLQHTIADLLFFLFSSLVLVCFHWLKFPPQNLLPSVFSNTNMALFSLHFLVHLPWYNHNGWLGVKQQVTYLLLSADLKQTKAGSTCGKSTNNGSQSVLKRCHMTS